MNRIALCLLGVVLSVTTTAYGQTKASLSGFVRDAASGETLILANVYLAGSTTGAATNTSGFYTITGIEPGTYTVVASYLGYDEFRQEVTLAPGEARRFDIDLEPDVVTSEEVVVSAERETVEETRNIGVSQMKTQDIKRLPTVFEPDVFRSLQLLPGVKAVSDFSSGIYVRGGGPDQTLILLDHNTVYNPSHFFGFFSTFNPDAIKDVRMYKGGYPAEYGGRLGAVLDVYNKDGNRREYQGGLSMGLLASRAYVEGPYGKGSWMLAARRSTLEPLLAALNASDVENIPDAFYFYDVNGKINFDASPNDRLSLAFYSGRDKLSMEFLEDASADIALGNTTVSANWTRVFSDRLFSNFIFTSSRYGSAPRMSFGGTAFARDNDVYDTSVKADFEYIPNPQHALKVGIHGGNFVMRLQDQFDDETTLDERIQTTYASLFVQETYRPTPLWMVRAGVRASYFDQGDYLRLEPRLSLEYRPMDRLRLQAGYGRYYQFLTLVTSEVFSAFDMWLTTDEGVGPAHGDQFVGGAKLNLGRGYFLDVEGYYRTMRNLFELDPFLFDAAGLDYADIFRFGTGYAYGTEWMLERTRGRLTGFIGYTYGKTRRRFPNVNDFNYYAPKYDRTHDVNVVLNYRLGRKWQLSSVFTYATGQAYTEPSQQFRLVDYPLGSQAPSGLISHYNRARLPAYHRLDVGLSRTGRFFGFADYEFQVQLINAYSRSNVWFYFFEFEDDNTIKRTEVPQIPVPIPNIALSLTF